MTDDKPNAMDEGAGASLLAPVFDIDSWLASPALVALPMLVPSPMPAVDHSALGEIVADSLFGEVIDISDLIPKLLDQSTETSSEPIEMATDAVDLVAAEPADDIFAGSMPLSLLFEEDGSQGHGTL